LENKSENTGSQNPKWNLHGYVIEQSGKDLFSWTLYTHIHTDTEWEVVWGECFRIGETLLMGSYKIMDNLRKDCDDPDDPVTFLPTLPKWDKTKYFVKGVDAGGVGLKDCVTGELVTDQKITDAIMPTLGFVKASK